GGRHLVEEGDADPVAVLVAVDGVTGAVQDDLGALGGGVLYVGGDLVAVGFGDEGAHLGRGVVAGTDLDLLGALADLLDQGVADRAGGDDRGDRHAALAGGAVGRRDDRVGRGVEVGVGQH